MIVALRGRYCVSSAQEAARRGACSSRNFRLRKFSQHFKPAFNSTTVCEASNSPLVKGAAALGIGGGLYYVWKAFSSEAAEALTAEVLGRQDSTTSASIIAAFKSDATFVALSKKLSSDIVRRDDEDGVKLQSGIDIAINKSVLAKDIKVEKIRKVMVTGKTADQVADEIIKALGAAPSKGCVMTLQGLSGTGKGTTVAKLKEKLPNAQTWSNGNLFRSLTLLAVTYSEQNRCSLQDALKPDVLASFVKMLEFGKFNGKFDVKIEGLGLKYFVSEVEKTVLKEPRVGKNIPTVAEVTQGEVVNFVQGALAQMAASGVNVLLEGREQTLNYIRTPHRFELVLKDVNIIGMRQAALVMGAEADKKIKSQPGASMEAVKTACEEALAKMAKS
eukprot:gnl/MRDRNA2_/MRDRNA2_103953_c0_seq1.p1 gnl/MRDRNA2_/MRDRNA2_103953_c0~~gnl/MRDRNA2_/MRDRNA2_103953_c0_seq1.p1  ORF type:complete len:389 (+),score=120.32 gnl/MRDRNA2_/MRDRNA2_103953_c0_seq1:64-1230(+)